MAKKEQNQKSVTKNTSSKKEEKKKTAKDYLLTGLGIIFHWVLFDTRKIPVGLPYDHHKKERAAAMALRRQGEGIGKGSTWEAARSGHYDSGRQYIGKKINTWGLYCLCRDADWGFSARCSIIRKNPVPPEKPAKDASPEELKDYERKMEGHAKKNPAYHLYITLVPPPARPEDEDQRVYEILMGELEDQPQKRGARPRAKVTWFEKIPITMVENEDGTKEEIELFQLVQIDQKTIDQIERLLRSDYDRINLWDNTGAGNPITINLRNPIRESDSENHTKISALFEEAGLGFEFDECAECKGLISRKAEFCPHCKAELEPSEEMEFSTCPTCLFDKVPYGQNCPQCTSAFWPTFCPLCSGKIYSDDTLCYHCHRSLKPCPKCGKIHLQTADRCLVCKHVFEEEDIHDLMIEGLTEALDGIKTVQRSELRKIMKRAGQKMQEPDKAPAPEKKAKAKETKPESKPEPTPKAKPQPKPEPEPKPTPDPPPPPPKPTMKTCLGCGNKVATGFCSKCGEHLVPCDKCDGWYPMTLKGCPKCQQQEEDETSSAEAKQPLKENSRNGKKRDKAGKRGDFGKGKGRRNGKPHPEEDI